MNDGKGQETRSSSRSDGSTSGAPGDSVWILRELLRYDWPRPVLVTVVAPGIVAAAQRLEHSSFIPHPSSLGFTVRPRWELETASVLS